MCGFAAVAGKDDPELLAWMLGRIGHRGPDGRGTARAGDVLLGHARLAIVDVEGGRQPMFNEAGDLAVAFNGEIYNHRELRGPIEPRHRFLTRSDTEVLVHLFEEEAADMLPRLDGMFALAVAGPGGLLLARDPLGIKPLYYGTRGGAFLASSELGAFPAMDDLRALPAGHALVAGGEPWRFAYPFAPSAAVAGISREEAVAGVRWRLEEAVRKRMMGDVPVGVFLSGGLDSSVVAALMRPHADRLLSFTAGMEGAPDLEAARRVAADLGTEHHELIYTAQDVERALPEVVARLESFDAPLVRSAIPMWFIARLASKHVKVALTGEGADEAFAGYAYLASFGGGEALRGELDRITERLQDTNLQRADRMTMAHGLEARVPFLDAALLRFVRRLPTGYLEPGVGGREKRLLRDAALGLLPSGILARPKQKFSEGAGSAHVVAESQASRIGAAEFESERHVPGGPPLRSPEELVYYRLWRDSTGGRIPPSLVGRTRDPGAAVRP